MGSLGKADREHWTGRRAGALTRHIFNQLATRGWQDVNSADIARLQRKDAPAVKPSKYRNQRVEVGGVMFDSKREAAAWMRLKAREQAGEIRNLKRQVEFPLLCPVTMSEGMNAEVARYVADFTYDDVETGVTHVLDAKGMVTQVYALKRRWLKFQTGIQIEEV